MYSLIELKTLVSSGRDPARSLPLRRGFLLIPLILVSFAFLPQMQAGTLPPELPGNPDGGYAGLNTAEGSNALNGPAPFTGAANTAVGSSALASNIDGFSNTAVGVGTLLHSFFGFGNTAVGALALAHNDSDQAGSGVFNTAVGDGALLFNVDGAANTAVGVGALNDNTVASGLTAVGTDALFSNDNSGSGAAIHKTAVGTFALATNTDSINKPA